MHSTHVLWYKKPADLWTEALPIGIGRIGAMVFGNPENERFALNDDTLRSGTPHQATISGGPEALKQARQLMDEGKFHEAQRLVDPEEKRLALRQIMRHYTGRETWDFPDAALEKTAVWALRAHWFTAKERGCMEYRGRPLRAAPSVLPQKWRPRVFLLRLGSGFAIINRTAVPGPRGGTEKRGGERLADPGH